MGLPRLRELLAEEHPASTAHVRCCPECRGRLETERRYLASLRHAEVPRASHSLHERLIERTQYLAAQAERAEGCRVGGRGTARALVRGGLSVLAGAAACAAALAMTAYAVAGDPGHRGLQGTSAAALVRTASADLWGGAVQVSSGSSAGAMPRVEEPLERIGRGLRMVFGASGRP